MLVEALARTPGTLLRRELADDDWTLDQHLLAVAIDQLALANWQRQGKPGARRPDPVSPFAKKPEPQHVGKAADIDQTLAILNGYRTGAYDRG